METQAILSLTALLTLGSLTPAFADDLTTIGTYRVISTGLNCRLGPSTDLRVRELIPRGAEVLAEEIVYDDFDQPWFVTVQGCFVRADSAYLQYIGALPEMY